jgi:purine-nucleoside phosphorylase
MSDPVRDLEASAAAWERRGWGRVEAILVSGSGLGVGLGEPAHGPVPLGEVLPFPVHAVVGHSLAVEVLEPVPGRRVLYYRGRLHSYQGYDAHQVVLPVRLGARLGARVLLLTNAAGGLDPAFRPGQLKLITDHLNLMGLNPLRGELPAAWGPRFPDMSAAYDAGLGRLIADTAAGLGIELGEGVYAGLAGPSYETPAEVRMLRTVGADLGGMSTVLEVIAARHLGLRCAALSLVTNLASGVAHGVLGHEEVLAAGRAAAAAVASLLTAVLAHPRLLDGP